MNVPYVSQVGPGLQAGAPGVGGWGVGTSAAGMLNFGVDAGRSNGRELTVTGNLAQQGMSPMLPGVGYGMQQQFGCGKHDDWRWFFKE